MFSKSTLRTIILILALATSLIHFALNFTMGRFDPVFTANGLGYLALAAAFLYPFGFLKGRQKLIQVVFIVYTAVTILAWLAMGEKNIATLQGMLGYSDKLIEILLIAALVRHGPNVH